MSSAVRQQAVVFSVLLHLAVVGALTVGFRWPARQRMAVNAAPIQGVIVDEAVLTRETERREQSARQERQRREREEREKREAADAARRAEEQRQREHDEALKREQELAAEQQRERERVARERAEAEKREQERVAQERREREAREQREREEAERRAAAARQQARLEAELQEALAAEAEQQAAVNAGLLDQYVRLIENRIEGKWVRPLSAKPGLDCVVNVVQLPTGDVVDVRVGSCNGDDAVVRSIEAAVRLASPLPKPPTPSLFERNLNVRFRPDL
jgi:colicin import membrane protein